MMHVFLAAFQIDARAALRLLLFNSGMQVVGESADWATTLHLAQETQPQLVLIDAELIPCVTHNRLTPLRHICPTANIIVLVNQLNTHHHATLAAEADLLLDKSIMPDRIAKRILVAGGRTLSD